MILKHNLISSDIPSMIQKVSYNEHLSDTSKDIVIRELEYISECIDKHMDAKELDVTFIHDKLRTRLVSDDLEVIENMLFTASLKHTDINIEDVSIEESVTIPVEDKIDDRIPVIFIFSGGDNVVSKLIMAVTRADYSHVSVTTEGLDEIISFGTTKQNYGLVVENWLDFCHIRKPKNIAVHVIDLPVKQYSKIKTTIEYHKFNNHKYYYSWRKLFTVPFKSLFKLKDDPQGFICSEFIYFLTKGTYITKSGMNKADYLITPDDFRKLILKRSTVVYSGSLANFNPIVVKNVYSLYSDDVLNQKREMDVRIQQSFKDKLKGKSQEQMDNFKLYLNK